MDIINGYFRQHYPPDAVTAWESEWCGNDVCRRYVGDRAAHSTIFPSIVCADGFTMSVQGHFGAYSYPRDDFADEYATVEIMGPPNIAEMMDYQPYAVGDEMIYAYVPVKVAAAVIEQHGGIA